MAAGILRSSPVVHPINQAFSGLVTFVSLLKALIIALDKKLQAAKALGLISITLCGISSVLRELPSKASSPIVFNLVLIKLILLK
jgi:hypothetical protein